MLFVQFRVHPAVDAPNRRQRQDVSPSRSSSLLPPGSVSTFASNRSHVCRPKKFFGADTVTNISPPGPATMSSTRRRVAFENKYKKPKSKSFRRRAYSSGSSPMSTTMNCRTDSGRKGVRGQERDRRRHLKVNIANKKSEKPPTPTRAKIRPAHRRSRPDRYRPRLRTNPPVTSLPNPLHLSRARRRRQKQVTGRLHVIGNEGEFVTPGTGGLPGGLWSRRLVQQRRGRLGGGDRQADERAKSRGSSAGRRASPI